MPRPRLCRRIGFNPSITYFKPQGVPMRSLDVVELTIEELEAYRLRYVENMEQNDGAKEMDTSQSTYQRILSSANKKIADALINGKAIKIMCLYFTKLAPIFKIADNVPRAERVVKRN